MLRRLKRRQGGLSSGVHVSKIMEWTEVGRTSQDRGLHERGSRHGRGRHKASERASTGKEEVQWV